MDWSRQDLDDAGLRALLAALAPVRPRLLQLRLFRNRLTCAGAQAREATRAQGARGISC